MNAWKLAASVLLAALYGYSAEHTGGVSGDTGFQGETGKPDTALAYERRVDIRLPVARIDAQLAASRNARNSGRFGQCDVLTIEQRGGIGHYVEPTVHIVPDGVEELIAVTAEGGTLKSWQTRTGDLAQTVANTRQQCKRLQREYQTLQQYQRHKDMNVDDLLALAEEIAAVEAQLTGSAQVDARQQQRIATNPLTLSFSSEAQPDSRLSQLVTAARQLLDDLVDGTIAAMKFFAYSLPFLVVLLPLGLLLRGLWRWLRQPDKSEARRVQACGRTGRVRSFAQDRLTGLTTHKEEDR